MSTDHNLQIRRAVLPRLKAETVIASLTTGRVYGEQPPSEPEWPFLRYGFSIGTATEWSCVEGSENAVTVNVFARGPGTDECDRLNKATIRALDGKTLQLEADPDTGQSATAIEVTHLGSEIMRDTTEANDYHGVNRFLIVAADDL